MCTRIEDYSCSANIQNHLQWWNLSATSVPFQMVLQGKCLFLKWIYSFKKRTPYIRSNSVIQQYLHLSGTTVCILHLCLVRKRYMYFSHTHLLFYIVSVWFSNVVCCYLANSIILSMCLCLIFVFSFSSILVHLLFG